MTLLIKYFGAIADRTGISSETFGKSGQMLLSAVLAEILDKYNFDGITYRVAVNRQFPETDPALRDGDELAFLPPFAGG